MLWIPATLPHVRVMREVTDTKATFTRVFVPSCYKITACCYFRQCFPPLLYLKSCSLQCKESGICLVCCSTTCQYNQFKKATVPFFGLVLLLLCPSLSSLSSRSLQRRTCSSLIFRNRILFCSSLRASSTSGSTHMSSRILASILPLFAGHQ